MLNVVFVLACLAGMSLIARRWYALSQNLIDDVRANRIGRDIHFRFPQGNDLS